MTLPASGAISMSQVNVELGFPSSRPISFDDPSVRQLFGVPTGAISLSDGYGKTALATVIDRMITTGTDDAQVDYSGYIGGGFSTDFPIIFIGESLTASYVACFLFRNITIPRGAVIDVAYMSFYAVTSASNVRCNTQVFSEASDSPVTFSTQSDYGNRYIYMNPVTWNDIPAWTGTGGGWDPFIGNRYNTPSLITIVQPPINRSGWVSGNNLAFYIKDNNTDWSDYNASRPIHSFDRDYNDGTDISRAPSIHIEYHL